MIRLSNGFEFEVAVSSGALGFHGLGWPWERPLAWAGLLRPQDFDVVVAKTVTAEPRRGNLRWWHPWTCVHMMPGGNTLNAVGMTNPGIAAWSIRDYYCGRESGVSLAASVHAATTQEALKLTAWLAALPSGGSPFVEVNLSCPNVASLAERVTARDILRCLHDYQPYPLIVKLGHGQVHRRLIEDLNPYCEAFHAINAVPWPYYHGFEPSPLQRYPHGQNGALSGPLIRGLALDCVRDLADLTDRPIVGGGGIFGIPDMVEFEHAGASAFSIGSCFLHHPTWPNKILKSWRERRASETAQDCAGRILPRPTLNIRAAAGTASWLILGGQAQQKKGPGS